MYLQEPFTTCFFIAAARVVCSPHVLQHSSLHICGRPRSCPTVLSQACPSDEPGCSECSCTHLAVAVAGELRDEADVVFSDLHHLLTDVVLGADAALSARPPGQKSNRVRTQLPLRDPRDSCSLHFNALQACHPQGKCQPVSSLWCGFLQRWSHTA